MPDSHKPSCLTTPPDPHVEAHRLLTLIETLYQELNQGQSPHPSLTLDTQLENGLGFDSLIRAELFQRTERLFDITLADQALALSETPRGLLNAICLAQQAPQSVKQTIGEIQLDRVSHTPDHVTTLQGLLDWHAEQHPDRPHLYVYQNATDIDTISYRELQQHAMTIAQGLSHRGIEPGDTVAIMLPTSNDYFFCFFGILYARAIPVPIYPPARPSQIEDHLIRHAKILQNAGTKLMITVNEAKPLSQLLRLQVDAIQDIMTVSELQSTTSATLDIGLPHTDDIAFLQYTSGSTGVPKGVTLTHANLLANIRAMGKAVNASSNDVFVSWLPVYHDMGLIGAWLGSLYHAMPLVIMSPLMFLSKPQRWLWAIHQHKGTLSPAPNFAYELCVNKIDERDIEGLDLSHWRLSWNGAEPISPRTLAKFTARFAPYGFRPEALSPVYGLAESSVGLTFPTHIRPPRIEQVDRHTMMRSGRAVRRQGVDPTANDHTADKQATDNHDTLSLIGLGHALADHQIRIVDAFGQELPERQEGELEFKGPSATQGYYHEPEKTQALFHDGWLKTGDLGLTIDGELFLTGRTKDIIIKAGRNIHPHELEAAISELSGIRKGCVAAFACANPQSGTEQLIVLAESKTTDEATKQQLSSQIQTLAVNLLSVPADDVVICPPHTVPKTSSGKIRRSACKTLYEANNLQAPQRAVWWQTMRLATLGLMPTAKRLLRAAGDYVFAAYMWLVMIGLTLSVWCLVALLPSQRACWAVTRAGAKALIRLTGTRFVVEGKHNLPPKGQPCVIVANHASYLDGLVLAAATGLDHQFVAKAELQHQWVSRVFLTKIGSHFVERFDTEKSVSDSQKLADHAVSAQPLTIFPEGTLYRMAGIHDFHLGAFQIAAQHQLPVIPITLCGTRSMLRNRSLFPHRGEIRVCIAPAILPDHDDWQAAVTLRDRARAVILQRSGEPDLAKATTH
ncbi:AMP-binding protein [Photobacterium japonica]|uniref:AMP-binding protein n=1 Tax=Photobacterium japonica TaxID=2910235 RepID=UPI003D0C1C50